MAKKPENPRIKVTEKRFSIVIPALNEERIIEETLDNLQRMQPGVEIVVADGRSTDHTVEVALKHGAKVVSEKGGFRSIAAGRNAGAKAASAPILVFIDADTIPQHGFFDRMLKEFDDTNVVGVGCKIMPAIDGPFTQFMFEFFNIMIATSVFFRQPAIAGNCVAYRKTAFDAINGFNEDMHASEDQDLCVRISKKGRVVYLRGVTAFTSSRRLRKLGWPGLILDWGRNTLYFLSGRTITRYAIVREV